MCKTFLASYRKEFWFNLQKRGYLVCMGLQRQFVCLFTIWCLLVSYIMLCLATDGAVAHEVCDFNQTFLHVLFVKLCYNSNSVSKLQKSVQFKSHFCHCLTWHHSDIQSTSINVHNDVKSQGISIWANYDYNSQLLVDIPL